MFKFLTAIANAFHKYSEDNATRYELQRMTDYELADIGITRGDIESVVRGTYVNAYNR